METDNRIGDIFKGVKKYKKGLKFKAIGYIGDTVYEKKKSRWTIDEHVINLSARGRKAALASKNKVTRGLDGRFKSKELVTHDPPLIDRVRKLEQEVLGDVGRSLKERVEALEAPVQARDMEMITIYKWIKTFNRRIELLENKQRPRSCCGGLSEGNGTC